MQIRKSTWTTEIRAGCVTFVTVAYILAVNASILSLTGGPCKYENQRGLQKYALVASHL